jgi:DNA-binding XRE family transcriptional regulator
MTNTKEKLVLNVQVTKKLADFLEQEKIKREVTISHLIRESLRKTYPEVYSQ